MSAEAVTKKRGRPKKADKTVTAAHEQSEATIVTTSKQSTKSRSITTAKSSSTGAASKKPSRRRKLADVDEFEDGDGKLLSQLESPVTFKNTKPAIRSSAPRSAILDEARAFTELKQSIPARDQIISASKAGHQNSSDNNASPESLVPSAAPSDEFRSTRSISVPDTGVPSTTSSSLELPEPAEKNESRSSFLSDFLADTPDTVPEAPESAKISDRSAFRSQSFSIDEIVSGAGVSDLKTLTATIEEKPNVKPPRQSAIPIKTPKAFKSHSLVSFPDQPEKQKSDSPPTQKSVNPETYNLSSFQSLKPATTSSQSKSMPPARPTQTSSTVQISQTPPTTATMTQSSSEAHTQQAPQKAAIKSTPPPSPTPAPTRSPSQPQSQPQPPPSRLPLTLPSSQPNRPTVISPATPTTPAHLRPKRPTEMTPAELLKNPDFKSLRRKWTSVIVGIPILVVTSYLLWDRLDKEEKAKGWVPTPGPVEERRRGELPRRILDDGALERK